MKTSTILIVAGVGVVVYYFATRPPTAQTLANGSGGYTISAGGSEGNGPLGQTTGFLNSLLGTDIF